MKNHWKTMVFQGFSRFHYFRVLARFVTLFCSKIAQMVLFWRPKIPEGCPKGSQRVSWEVMGDCWGRSFSAVEPPSGHSGSLFGTTWRLWSSNLAIWRPKQWFSIISITFFLVCEPKTYKKTMLLHCIIMEFQGGSLGSLLARLGESDAQFWQLESLN